MGSAHTKRGDCQSLSDHTYWKVTRPDGTDFYSGKINYRESIGKVVRVPTFESKANPVICSPSVIHASRQPIQALRYGKIPCSLFRVEGKPVVEDTDKAGFKEFQVIQEIDESLKGDYFGLKWNEVIHPFDPRKVNVESVSETHLSELRTYASVLDSVLASVWASVWDSVRASVRASVLDSVLASVWASVWASVLDSVRASVRDSVWDSVWASVLDSEASYIGSLFTQIKEWEYTEKVKVNGYPFQSCVNLIKQGLIPATDGKKWFLMGFKNEKARVLWSGKP
jgi:hypothetical protein